MALPPPVLPLDETALIDEAAVALGADLGALMEAAGAAVARAAQRLAPAGTILVACGGGHNGGDGWVCARLLAEAGRSVQVWPVAPPTAPLCRAAAERARPLVAELAACPPAPPALVVDAILGAGVHGAPREPVAGALRALAALGAPILAIDAPSGIGTPLCLPARLTICLQAAKSELLAPGAPGEFATVDIGLPAAAWQEIQPACLRRFPRHRRQGHKGQHGELLVVGGGAFPGALEFACRAGVRSGCDLVRAWTSEGPALPPTVVAHRQPGEALAAADPGQLTPLLARASAVLIGPGMGRSAGAVEAARQAFGLAWEMGVPAVVDADGIAACAELLRALPAGPTPVVVTPHRGEARTLLGREVDEEALHAFARPDRVLLAKAPVDLVTDGRRWQRNHRGNPRMAVGGTGDVLAGLAAGLLARGGGAYDAARMAVLWTTAAGDRCWAQQGPCYDALDLLAELPATLHQLLAPLGMWPPVAD